MKGAQGSGKQSGFSTRAAPPDAHVSLRDNALPALGFYFMVILIISACFPCPWFPAFYISHSQNVDSWRPFSGNVLQNFIHSSWVRYSENAAAQKAADQEVRLDHRYHQESLYPSLWQVIPAAFRPRFASLNQRLVGMILVAYIKLMVRVGNR